MNYYEIAKLFPGKYRKAILKNNHIYKAVVKYDDYDMMQLFFMYSNFIEPNNTYYEYEILNRKIVAKEQCLVCLRNILDKFKLIEPYFIILEKEYIMLENLKM